MPHIEKHEQIKAVPVSEMLAEQLDKCEQLWKQRGLAVTGIPSGYGNIDNLLSGFQPSDMIIIAGRPSMGKSAAGMNIAANACKDGVSVGVFSLEMSKEQLVRRLMARESRVDLSCFRNGVFLQEDWERIMEAANEIVSWQLYVDDSAALHHVELSRRAREMKERYGIELLIIDYLQLMTSDTPRDPTLETTTISKAMKQIAKDLSIPVIAISQLNRKLEERGDKRPILSDLKQSSSLEENADIVIFVYRDEVYNNDPHNPDRGIAEWLVRKHRHGPVASLRLAFLPNFCCFENLRTDHCLDGSGDRGEV